MRYDFDDPYKILACSLFVSYSFYEIGRMLYDSEFLKQCIRHEIRNQDFSGQFVDCIIDDLYDSKERMELMRAFDELALFFYHHLDKNRLRKEIRSLVDEIGVALPYSTGGSDSSEST